MLEHGGNLRAAAAAFGRAPADWIDLSTGINPHAYAAPPLAADVWQRLPEADPALAEAACACYGAPAMLALAGSQAAIQALPRLRAPGRVVLAARSYAEHALHWSRHGHTLQRVEPAALELALDAADVVVLCNPDNPTGARVPPQQLLAWADRLAARGGWLVVDEAFADMTPQLSVAPYSAHPALVVLRSVGKFFGLAGLRLGFAGAAPALLNRLENLLGPWTVSAAAQQIGRATLRDHAWQAAMRTRLAREEARLDTLLAAHGIAAAGCALFRWWPEPRAQQFWRHMAERGIWVRRFDDARHGIRLGLPAGEPAWQGLEQALIEWKMEQA